MPLLFESSHSLGPAELHFQEFAPGAVLAKVVRCYWTFARSSGNGIGLRHRVLPDGCTDLVFDFGGRPRAMVVGPMTAVLVSEFQSFTTLAVSFFPGGASRILGCGLDQLRDRIVPLEEFWGGSTERILERLQHAGSCAERRVVLDQEFVGRGAVAVETDAQVDRVLKHLYSTQGQLTVAELAERAALCDRQLRRRMLTETGYTPKQLIRILRFQFSVLDLLRRPRGDGAGVAVDGGYYDQSHFVREFRAMSGLAPAAFVGAARSGECPIFAIPSRGTLAYDRR